MSTVVMMHRVTEHGRMVSVVMLVMMVSRRYHGVAVGVTVVIVAAVGRAATGAAVAVAQTQKFLNGERRSLR